MITPARFRGVQWVSLAAFALAPAAGFAQQEKLDAASVKLEAIAAPEPAPDQTAQDTTKLLSVPGGKALGMSVLGNQDAPTSLVIVPWKSSELGGLVGITPMLDDSRQPVDKEVFMRMLSYYEIRSESAQPGAAPAVMNAAQPAATAEGKPSYNNNKSETAQPGDAPAKWSAKQTVSAAQRRKQ